MDVKRRIGSRIYNVSTSTFIGTCESGGTSVDDSCVENLYKKYGANGEFFVYGKGGKNTKYARQKYTGWRRGELVWPLSKSAGEAAAYCIGLPNYGALNGIDWRFPSEHPVDAAVRQLERVKDSWFLGWQIGMSFSAGGERWSASRGDNPPAADLPDDIRAVGAVAAKGAGFCGRFEEVMRAENGYILKLWIYGGYNKPRRLVGCYMMDNTQCKHWRDLWESTQERVGNVEKSLIG